MNAFKKIHSHCYRNNEIYSVLIKKKGETKSLHHEVNIEKT